MFDGTTSLRENEPIPIRLSIVPLIASRPPDMWLTVVAIALVDTPVWTLFIVPAAKLVRVPVPPRDTTWPFGASPLRRAR